MLQDNSSGYDGLRRGAALVEKPVGRLLMRGADRRAYLQGLLTNDIAALTPGTGCYAAMLTAQGRMMTDMRVLELGDALLLDLPRAVVSSIREHLERFVFSEDVTIEDVSDSLVELGVYGPGTVTVLAAARTEGGVPEALYATTRVRLAGQDATLVRSDDIGVSGVDVLVPAAGAEAVRAALLDAGAVAATAADVEAVRVESGRPWFGRDMDADTIPLEAGLEDRAISRSKGCYVGQEVIVRVQDRGHGRVARRLTGLVLDRQDAVPTGGAVIRAGDREIGRVTSAVWSPSLARPIALGYVHRDFLVVGTRVTIDDASAKVMSLPMVSGQDRWSEK